MTPDAAIDAEVIELAWRLLEDLDIGGLTLLINSIGDPECRPAYVGMLKDYYSSAVGDICHNCRRRLERNPLRLLDCKEDQCQPSIAGAPAGADHLCGPCLEHWETLPRLPGGPGTSVHGGEATGARLRLLHPHRVRDRPARHGPDEHHLRRRPVRWPHRRAGRKADPRHRLRDGHRAHPAGAAPPGRRPVRKRGAEGGSGPHGRGRQERGYAPCRRPPRQWRGGSARALGPQPEGPAPGTRRP